MADTAQQRRPEPGGPGFHPPGRGGFGGRGGHHHHGMPVEKPKDFRRTVGRLWKYFGAERGYLIFVFICVLAAAGCGLAVPFILGRVIDLLSAGKNAVDFTKLASFIAVLAVVYLSDGLVNFLQGWVMAGVSQRIVRQLRRTLFEKLGRLPVSFFDSRTHGELMSRLANDVENVSGTISQATVQLMSGVIAIIGSFTMMLILSPLLTLASVVTIPLVFLLINVVTKKTLPLFKEQQAVLGRLNGHIEETMSGLHVVKAFNHEAAAIADFERYNNTLRTVGIKAQIWSGYIMPLMNVINNIGFTLIAGVGGVLAVGGAITVGVIASFLGYSRQFTRPLNELANIFNMLQSAVAGAERVFEIIDEQEEPSDPKDAVSLTTPRGDVVFTDVSFGYRPDVPVLKNISFTAPSGSDTALVGPTGAGKTTIVNLLARFYDVTEGSIFIDGRDIRDYTRDSLRRCFGIVLQDTYLFSGTVRENIRYGRLDATDAEVEHAALMANADIFIRRLPNGYETALTESGGSLSQGQRQLITIARAILADPCILILDEATSSVDTRTELHIQEAMRKLMRGRTSFIIAHRLSTIRDADVIMVIDNGIIVERGHHDELMKEPGVYQTMYLSQYANTESEQVSDRELDLHDSH
ncbi:MAG: ABC transporter ATP-binding protein [Spirochaetes bacterium]|nr:ABC transporter ATP-binding protein [Spirochaetota bacterium]